ncbi:MAG: AMP nucleosidase, partial [Hyphomicrobiales bacterium]|nr:AMP nucleosidase [Hyphomicrobiales bacterium]
MDKTLRSSLVSVETPEEAVARLDRLHSDATNALRQALERFLETREPPAPDARARFRYPEIRVTYEPEGLQPLVRRAFAKFPAPGVYATTVTQPAAFRSYLLEQLRPLMSEYGATVEVGVSGEEIPY